MRTTEPEALAHRLTTEQVLQSFTLEDATAARDELKRALDMARIVLGQHARDRSAAIAEFWRHSGAARRQWVNRASFEDRAWQAQRDRVQALDVAYIRAERHLKGLLVPAVMERAAPGLFDIVNRAAAAVAEMV
jgi:hypothetical protein